MKVTFIGAAHEVTGSCTLLELGGKTYMIDCGMEQGTDVFENAELPVAPGLIDAVFLTHAHIDHSGMLPKLFKDGFQGRIFTTETTANLCEIMLRDSAHIQESDVEWKNRKAARFGGEPLEPVYTLQDAEGALKLFRPCHYGEKYAAEENLEFRFTDIGHLLGSACIEMWLTEDGVSKKIVFSGDVGNTNQPIIRDPQNVDAADYLVIESTYGDRLHDKPGDTVAEFAAVIKKAFDRGGSVIIPSFAVGRTQELLYALREIKNSGALDAYGHFPVYIDSPLAAESTQIFLQCDENYFDDTTRELLHKGINPIWFEGIRLSVTADESKLINANPERKIIISASGMCEAGRIRHHLKHNLWKPENVILFVGYQAENSLGRKLLEGATSVKLFGEEIAVKAEICSLHGTSGHADRDGLLRWMGGFTQKPGTVFVNHGDEQSCESFRSLLENEMGFHAIAPFSGTCYDLKMDTMAEQTVGIRIVKKEQVVRTPSRGLWSALVRAAEALLGTAKGYKERPNKEIAQFTKEIDKLNQKWK